MQSKHLLVSWIWKSSHSLLLWVCDANGKLSIYILLWPGLQPALGSAWEVSTVNMWTHPVIPPTQLYQMLIPALDISTRSSDKLHVVSIWITILIVLSDRASLGATLRKEDVWAMFGWQKGLASSPPVDCVFAQWLRFRSADTRDVAACQNRNTEMSRGPTNCIGLRTRVIPR